MKHLTFCALLFAGLTTMGSAQYDLTIDSSPAVQEGLTTYRFYVNMADATDRMSAVYGNDQEGLYISTPDGAFQQRFQFKLECLRHQPRISLAPSQNWRTTPTPPLV